MSGGRGRNDPTQVAMQPTNKVKQISRLAYRTLRKLLILKGLLPTWSRSTG